MTSTLGAPLHFVIRDRLDRTDDSCAATPDEVTKLVHFMAPLMPRVFSVDIAFKYKSSLLLNSVVSCWVKHGSGILPKIFKVWNSIKTEPVWLGDFTEVSPKDQVSCSESQSFFSSLETLAVHNCHTPLNIGLYEGLTHLNLEELHKDPTVQDLHRIFSASPDLHTLMIEDINLSHTEKTLEPVWLNSLQNLGLGQVDVTDCLKQLLPLLNTTSSIAVIMRMAVQPNFVSEAQGFFGRSKVERLFIFGVGRYHYTLITSLCPAPGLQELVVRDCSFNPHSSEDPFGSDNDELGRTPWPLLHTLYLIGCTIDRETLKRILELHPIRKLRIFSGYAHLDDTHKRTLEECVELEEFLAGKNIDVKVAPNETGCPKRSNFFDGMYA